METRSKPRMTLLHEGEQFKTLEVVGDEEADMPSHYCTSEAIVTILHGTVTLIMNNQEQDLRAGNSIPIPAEEVHELKIKEAFRAIVVMSRIARIEFSEQNE